MTVAPPPPVVPGGELRPPTGLVGAHKPSSHCVECRRMFVQEPPGSPDLAGLAEADDVFESVEHVGGVNGYTALRPKTYTVRTRRAPARARYHRPADYTAAGQSSSHTPG